MKVKNINNNNNIKELTQPKTQKNKNLNESNVIKSQSLPEKVDAKAVEDSAKVDVSQAAQQMKKAKGLATPSDDIDHAKVARLQNMIDEGSYKVDAHAVADRLVDSHLMFGE